MRAEAERFLHSPARMACLLLVALGAVAMSPLANLSAAPPSSWAAAGGASKGAAAVAGLLACGWAAGAVLDDREGRRLEQVIAAGCGVVRYLAAKLAPPLAFLLAAAAAGSAAVCAVVLVSCGRSDPLPYFVSLAIGYAPVILFAAGFGACTAALTGNRALALSLFAALWIMGGLAWLGTPASFRTVDVTGLALNEAFLQPVLVADDLPGMTRASARQVVETAAANRLYGRYNLVFLVGGGFVSMGMLATWLAWKFRMDALSLVTERRAGRLLVSLPASLLELKAMRLGRLTAIVLATAASGALVLAAPDAKGMGSVLVESLVPLAFALAFAGVFANDVRAGTSESILSTTRFRLPFARRLAVVAGALVATLLFQAVSFQGAMGADAPGILLMGLAPALFMGGLSFLLGVVSRSESTAAVGTVALWAFLHLPFATAFAALPIIGALYPFPATMGLAAGAPARVGAMLVGAALFGAGLALLGRPERLPEH